MILYHGSQSRFNKIDLSKAKEGKDFGKGFYLTTNKEQAIAWAKRIKDKKSYVYRYYLDDSVLEKDGLMIKRMTEYDEEWVKFVSKCRLTLYETKHDIIYDRMADSKFRLLTKALQDYYLGNISLNAVLFVAKFSNKSYNQYCFKTIKAISYLKYKGFMEVRK